MTRNGKQKHWFVKFAKSIFHLPYLSLDLYAQNVSNVWFITKQYT